MSRRVLFLENVSKEFTDEDTRCRTLDEVSLTASSDEIICIMGPSGCGKSTLLRIIEGLDLEYTGTVRGESDDPDNRPSTAMVFQEHALFPWLNVSDNIAYGLRLKARRTTPDEADRRVSELLALTHLEDFAKAMPYQLSGGMKQRAAVCRALAVRPEVLLMDEPFSALDAFTRRELQDELLRIRDDTGTTILLVTHSPEEAVYLADRVIVLSERPAAIVKTVSIELPRPRSHSDPAFIGIRESLMAMVRGDMGAP
jgi:ABC-type nitrate/sulfonate/bicarbonate transport system ATPase subunit